MRLLIFVAATIAAISGSPLTACSQHYYVVIGAFAADENASEFKGYLPGQARDTSYTIADQNNVLHYYVLKTSDKESAVAKSLQLRKEAESGSPGTSGGVAAREISAGENVLSVAPAAGTEELNGSLTASASGSGSSGTAGGLPPRPVGKYFKFRIESPEGDPVTAQVHHVDFEKGLELGAYSANTFVDLLRPGQSHEPMAVVCGVFGYKEIYKYIDYSDPSRTDREAYLDAQGAWVIPYRLERLEKGDVSVMYNVSFYKDAAIMRQKSEVDLEELVKMMHSNPYYEITIHAHCNGRNKREIIAPGMDKNYFDVAGSRQVRGTAKELTALRAEAIRAYLADNGIDERRVMIFAWGGSDMLVKADNPHADFNDRVEIEITRD